MYLKLLIEMFILLGQVFVCIMRHFCSFFLPARRKDISDDVILITGGGRGIGRLLALEFAKRRPRHLVLWGRHSGPLASTASAVTSATGVPCTYAECDVSSRHDVYTRALEIQDRIGDVTILVNNAGTVHGKNILNSSVEEMTHTLHVNCLAHMWLAKALLPTMLKKGRCHLVLVNSVLGLIGLAGAADYAASKFAAAGFAEALRLEMIDGYEGGSQIHVTSVHPYLVDTDMFAGCGTRFPSLFPPLEKEYVARRIVDAVLTNSTFVLMPRIMYLGYNLRSLVPVEALVEINRFTGVSKAMDNFHGRQKTLQS